MLRHKMEEIIVIGDITVEANEEFVNILVDRDVVLTMARQAEFGLDELADTLKALVK